MAFMLPAQQSLAETLGAGLSDVASHWANVKSSESALRGLGLNEAQAKSLARLQSPQLQQQLVQHQLQQQQQQASNAAINQILGEGLPQANYQPQSALQGLPQQPQMAPTRQTPQQAPIEQASSILQNPAFQKIQKQAQDAQQLQQAQLSPKGGIPTSSQAAGALPGEGQAIVANQIAQQKEPSIKDQIQQVRRQKQALSAANLPVNQAIALHQQLESKEKELRREAREERKENLEERKLSAIEQRAADKETLPVYKEINDKAKASKDSNIRLGRMEQLINRGQLSNTAFYNGIKALGKIPGIGGYIESIAESFLSPDTQEFEKLSTDFIKDAKQFFGNRITQQEVAMFLKTVPNLTQTNAGKNRVIRNMRIFNEAAGLRKNIMDEIIRDNNGKRPANLESLVEQRAEPQLNDLAEQFKGNIG